MERTITITAARQQFLDLTKKVKRHMQTYILTNKGEAEAVLLSVAEYRSLVAAGQLALNPDVLERTRLGMKELAAGEGVGVEAAFRATAAPGKAAKKRRELATASS